MHLLQSLGNGGVGLSHGYEFDADLIAARIVLVGAQGHRHQADQRRVDTGVVILQEVVQGIIDDGSHHVIDSGTGLFRHGLDIGQG